MKTSCHLSHHKSLASPDIRPKKTCMNLALKADIGYTGKSFKEKMIKCTSENYLIWSNVFLSILQWETSIATPEKKWKSWLHPNTKHTFLQHLKLISYSALLPDQRLMWKKSRRLIYGDLKLCWTVLGNRPDQKEEYHCQTLDNIYRAQNAQYLLFVAFMQWLVKYWATSEEEETLTESKPTQFLSWITPCILTQLPPIALQSFFLWCFLL